MDLYTIISSNLIEVKNKTFEINFSRMEKGKEYMY